MPKPTASETRARILCADAHRFAGLRFTVEWKQNRNGEDCPAIIYNGRPIDRITGSGFEKESTALAGTLRHLFPAANPTRKPDMKPARAHLMPLREAAHYLAHHSYGEAIQATHTSARAVDAYLLFWTWTAVHFSQRFDAPIRQAAARYANATGHASDSQHVQDWIDRRRARALNFWNWLKADDQANTCIQREYEEREDHSAGLMPASCHSTL